MSFVSRLRLGFMLVAVLAFLLGYCGFFGIMRVRHALYRAEALNSMFYHVSRVVYYEDLFLLTGDTVYNGEVEEAVNKLRIYINNGIGRSGIMNLLLRLAFIPSDADESIQVIYSTLGNFVDTVSRLNTMVYHFMDDKKMYVITDGFLNLLDTLLRYGYNKEAYSLAFAYGRVMLHRYDPLMVARVYDVALNISDVVKEEDVQKSVKGFLGALKKFKGEVVKLSNELRLYRELSRTLYSDIWHEGERQKGIANRAITFTIVSTTLLFLLLLSLLISMSYKFSTALSRYIARMGKALDSVSRGDFSKTLEHSSSDGEFGVMAAEYNKIMDLLNTSVGYIIHISKEALNTRVFGHEIELPAENPLIMARKIVETLVELNKYKNVIENDYSKDEIYDHLFKALSNKFGISSLVILELNESKNRLEPVFQQGTAPVPIDVVVNPDLCRAKRTASLVDAKAFPDICRFSVQNGEFFSVCIPMIMGGGVKGVVKIIESEDNRDRLIRDLPFIIKYIEITAPVVYAAKLLDITREQSLKDGLTGLYNRRFLDSYLEKYISFANRKGFIVGFIMIDIDNFKKVNDTYGHKNGDVVLKEVARVISSSVRSSDLVIRYGGEEFLVVLPDVSEGKTKEVAEKIRRSVEMTAIHIEGKVLHVTISAGVAEYPKHSEDVHQVIKFADIALYKAKKMGKNRVVVFDEKDMADMLSVSD